MLLQGAVGSSLEVPWQAPPAQGPRQQSRGACREPTGSQVVSYPVAVRAAAGLHGWGRMHLHPVDGVSPPGGKPGPGDDA